MNPVHLGLFIFYLISLCASVILSSRLWLIRKHPTCKIFLVWTISISWWLICGLLEILTSTLKSKIFWMNMSYLGIITFIVTWLLLCWCLTEKCKWIKAGNIVKLSILPAIILILIWTNHIHHLVWPIIWIDTRSIPWLDFTTKGWGFWLYAIFCCIYLLVGILTLLNYAITKSSSNQRVYTGMFLIAIFPCLIFLILLFNTGEFTKIDPAPIAFVITAAIFYRILSKNKFFSQTGVRKTNSENN